MEYNLKKRKSRGVEVKWNDLSVESYFKLRGKQKKKKKKLKSVKT